MNRKQKPIGMAFIFALVALTLLLLTLTSSSPSLKYEEITIGNETYPLVPCSELKQKHEITGIFYPDYFCSLIDANITPYWDFINIDDINETDILNFVAVYAAIDPIEFDFTNVTVTVTAKGSELWKCRDWNFTEKKCCGIWTKVMNITPGEKYSFTATPGNPGFAESIENLKMQSPAVCGNWAVRVNKTSVVSLGMHMRVKNIRNEKVAFTCSATNFDFKKKEIGRYKIKLDDHPIKEIEFNDLDISKEFDLKIDDAPETGNFVEVYAIDPAELNFTNATVTVTAKGNKLYKCTDWNFTGQKCCGNWAKVTDITSGEDYTFTLAPEDPGFGEILITKAMHLDENKDIISDIYNEVKAKDNIWSEPIYENEYVRVTFEKSLTSSNDITIYARNNQGLNTKIEVYYFNSAEKITEFSIINETKYYKVYLTNMMGSHDTFDLKVVNTDLETACLEFDRIVDPPDASNLTVTSCDVNDAYDPDCYDAISADGGTSYALGRYAHIDAPFQTLVPVGSVNSATLYYDSWGSLSGDWGIYVKDARNGTTICSADPAPEDGSETRNSVNCSSITPTQLENGVWLYIINNDNKGPEDINLDYVYLDVDYTQPPPNVTQAHYRWRNDDGVEWYNAGWPYRKIMPINGVSGAGTSYQVKIKVGESSGATDYDVHVEGNSQSDFDDIRFTDGDGTTLLDYWLESTTGTSPNQTATFWVEVKDNLDTNQNIYIYYGNSTVGSASNGFATFPLFDDFEDGALSPWNATGYWPFSIQPSDSICYGNYCAGNAHDEAGRADAYLDTSFTVQVSGNYRTQVFVAAKNTDTVQHTKTGHFSVYVDGTQRNDVDWDSTPTDPGQTLSTTSMSGSFSLDLTEHQFSMRFYRAYYEGDATTISAYTDNIIIRKYTASEPSVGAPGSEEDRETTEATWKASEDAPVTNQSKNENIRLRFSIKNTGGAAENYNYRLQVAEKTNATCEEQTTGWSDVLTTTGGCGSAVACMTNSTWFDDNAPTTNQLTSEGTWTAGRMVEDPSNQTGAITLNQSYFTEVEYNFQFTDNAGDDGPTYCFRVTNASIALDNYTKVATITLVDTAPPIINFTPPTPLNNSNLPQSYITANVTAQDSNLANITIYLYNSTNDLIDSATCSSSPCFYNFTGLSEGTYYLNATANDTGGYENQTETRTLMFTCNCSTCDECEAKLNDPACSTVNLIGNITNHSGTCINFPANNKIFDCQGNTMDGNGAGYAINISSTSPENITVRNCIIKDFERGIYADPVEPNDTIYAGGDGVEIRETEEENFYRCNNSVLTGNYSCGETGYETSKVLTSGKHIFELKSSNSIEYAKNNASVISNPMLVEPAETSNIEELKIKEIKSDKFAFKSLSDDLIEIGEEKHSPLQPYLKLNKWGGEVSLKVDVPYGKDGIKNLTQNKLRWSTCKYDIEFYPKKPEEICRISGFPQG